MQTAYPCNIGRTAFHYQRLFARHAILCSIIAQLMYRRVCGEDRQATTSPPTELAKHSSFVPRREAHFALENNLPSGLLALRNSASNISCALEGDPRRRVLYCLCANSTIGIMTYWYPRHTFTAGHRIQICPREQRSREEVLRN